MMSYHLRSSCCVWGSIILCFNMFSRIVLDSFTGMFEYRFVMSNDANVKCGNNGVSLRFWIRSVVFFTLKAFCNGAMWLILFVNSLDGL